jgi:uncharacterized membrane protein YdbT with pleckstrin-like domain
VDKTPNKTLDDEQKLYDSAPSMFRNRPFLYIFSWLAAIGGVIGLVYALINQGTSDSFWFALSIIAIIVGFIGFMILFVWWLEVINTRLTVTNERVTLRRGILSKNIREVFLSDIRSVQINQRFLQRIMGTGHIEVASAGSSDAEILIDGIPQAYSVKKIIDEHRRGQNMREKTND